MLEHPIYLRMPTENEEPLFKNASAAEAVISALILAQRKDWLRIHAFVILPDMLEMVCTPLKQGVSGIVAYLQAETIPQLMVLLPAAGMIWSRRFAHMPLETGSAYRARLNMLLLSPVAAGIIEEAEAYPYSSANPRYNSFVSAYAGFAKPGQTGMLTLPTEQKPIISELEKPATPITPDKADTTPSVPSAAAPVAPTVPAPIAVPVAEPTRPATDANVPVFQPKKNGNHAGD